MEHAYDLEVQGSPQMYRYNCRCSKKGHPWNSANQAEAEWRIHLEDMTTKVQVSIESDMASYKVLQPVLARLERTHGISVTVTPSVRN